MTTTDPRLAAELPPDPGLPGVRGLFRAGASLLGPFLSARGWSLVESRPVQVLYRPERSCIVRYRVRAINRDGDPRVVTLSAETRHRPGRSVAPPPSFEERYGLADPVERRGDHLVWAFPYDPSLEGLPEAAWGPSVRERLAAAGRPQRAVSVQPLRYRPRRRAVFRYTGLHGGRRAPAPESLFGKVLRADKLQRWADMPGSRNRTAIRLATPLDAPGLGPVLVPPIEGTSLRQLLLNGGSLPAPERVAALLDHVPEAIGGFSGQAEGHAPIRLAAAAQDLVARLVPEARGDADRVAVAVAEGAAGDRLAARVIHGDLYEAQIFVGDDYRLGLIDLDDAGPGDPAMDAANFSAHLVGLALVAPAATKRLMGYRGLVRRAFLTRLGIGSSDLAWREALCMLRLATGPFRVLDPRWPHEVHRRVALAVRLMDAA
jgi:hypothetical protein